MNKFLYCFTLVLSISLVSFCQAAPPGWLNPQGPDVTIHRSTQDTQLSWYNGPGDPQEWLVSYGAANRTRLKGFQDVTALQFDLAALRGRRVVRAELHLARANADPLFALVAATINTAWQEGRAWGKDAQPGEPCWRWRQRPADPESPQPGAEWTFPRSDFSSASFGNYGSLVSFAYKASGTFETYQADGQDWVRAWLDPDVIYALILDQYGLMVTDPRGYISYNPQIYTKDQNAALAPRLVVQTEEPELSPPLPAVESIHLLDGENAGELIVSFQSPSNEGADRTFGYTIRIGQGTPFEEAAPIERWRVPRPVSPGHVRQTLLEGLAPGEEYEVFIQAYDRLGQTSPVASAKKRLAVFTEKQLVQAALPAEPNPSGTGVATVPGVLRYWACPDTATFDPVSGLRLDETGTLREDEGYKVQNHVWLAGKNQIRLQAAKNEVVAFQVLIERLVEQLHQVRVTVSDLQGPDGTTIPAHPNVELFLLHTVEAQTGAFPDAAIPLADPFPSTFSIPHPHHNPSGVQQSLWVDVYVPRTAASGEYQGTVTIQAEELPQPLTLNLSLQVSPVSIPDDLSFIIDMNGYGNKWDYGNRDKTRLRWFQTLHKHRLSLNTLPYGWNANVIADRAPALTGEGAAVRVRDWTPFDTHYGPFFDGTAFSPNHPVLPYTGPGENTPVATFYTPIFESWPIRLSDLVYGFDAQGEGASYWNRVVDAKEDGFWRDGPEIAHGFSEDYKTGVQNIVRDWSLHAEEKGWHGTRFQIYLNHKYYYDSCDALWTLEECSTADDFKAVGFFHTLYRQGAALADPPYVRWHWRLDISDRWSQHYGQLDSTINWCVMSGSAADWYWPHRRYRSILQGQEEQWTWYGSGPAPGEPAIHHAQRFLQAWAQGLDGGVPYWDNFQTSWTKANPLSTVYSGQNVPGFGLYEGPILSIRAKRMRQAQQIVELANLLARQDGWSRARVTQALGSRYGEPNNNHTFATLDEETLAGLKADLLATLKPFYSPQAGIDPQPTVDQGEAQ